MAYKFQLGTAYLEGATTYEDTVTAEGAVSGAAGSFDAITATALNVQAGGITNAGSIAGATTIDASGDLTVGTITMAEFSVAADGDTDIDGTLNVEGVPTFQAGAVFSGGITTANAIAGATSISGSGLLSATTFDLDGAADLGGKLTVVGVSDLDGGIDVNGSKFTVSTAGAVVAESTVSGAAATFDTLAGTSLALQSGGISAAGAIAGATNISGSGLLSATTFDLDGAADLGGKLTVVGVSDLDGGIDVNASKFTVSTAGAVVAESTISGSGQLAGKELIIDDGQHIGIASDTDLLELSSGELGINGKIVVSSVSELVVDPNGDRPFLVWNSSNNAFDYLSWATFVTGVVGSGLSAANGKISLAAAGTITAIGNQDRDLVEGTNYASASLSAARTYTLPAASSLDDGDVVRVKMAGGVSDTNYAKITCSVGAADNIDGETEIRLESPYAAVMLYKVADNTFRVL
tara:strand:- start:24813 stop:26207 length:1395 start_codon:yes stop_codon:yes gene_type:complete